MITVPARRLRHPHPTVRAPPPLRSPCDARRAAFPSGSFPDRRIRNCVRSAAEQSHYTRLGYARNGSTRGAIWNAQPIASSRSEPARSRRGIGAARVGTRQRRAIRPARTGRDARPARCRNPCSTMWTGMTAEACDAAMSPLGRQRDAPRQERSVVRLVRRRAPIAMPLGFRHTIGARHWTPSGDRRRRSFARCSSRPIRPKSADSRPSRGTQPMPSIRRRA